ATEPRITRPSGEKPPGARISSTAPDTEAARLRAHRRGLGSFREPDEERGYSQGHGEPEGCRTHEQGRRRRIGEQHAKAGEEGGQAALGDPEASRQHGHRARERGERVDEGRRAKWQRDAEPTEDQGEREAFEEPRDHGQDERYREG